MKTRIGLLGGAFDPPHAAHVRLAQTAMEVLCLNQLRVLPTGLPWHRGQAPSAARHRVAMCRLAFRGISGVVVDEREIHRPGATYTIDTVRELQAEHAGADWYLIIGADQARRFQTWHRWEELLCLVHLAVADREVELGQWQNEALAQSVTLPWAPMAVSSTGIRRQLALGQSVPWLDAQVMGYIQQHQLYQSNP